MKSLYIILIILFLILIFLLYNFDTAGVNIIVFLTIMRGILTVNCRWWNLSEFYGDSSGVNLYHKFINRKDKIIPTNIFGSKTYIITDIDYIKKVLDNSPHIFGVGSFKYDFFKSFMKYNVGVSNGCPWKNRRQLNENVLDTDKNHRYSHIFANKIKEQFISSNPKNFDDFSKLGKKLAMIFVFNQENIYEPLFEMFSEANSFQTVLFGTININKYIKNSYYDYLKKQLDNPNKHSLLWLAKSINTLSREEIIHQVPHWIFPINGLLSVAFPRLLVLIYNNQRVLKKVKQRNKKYIRNCILELFRLNNPVNSTFRTLLKDFNFSEKYKYKKGDQFLILNNPVMRDPRYFKNPNSFIPERWNKINEKSYYALMFNQGPQKCPGKEFAIFILQTLVLVLLNNQGNIKYIHPKINTNNVPQMINPCKILIKYN